MKMIEIEELEKISELKELAEEWIANSQARNFGFAPEWAHIEADMTQWLTFTPGTTFVARYGKEIVSFLSVFGVRNPLTEGRIALVKYWYSKKGYNGGVLLLKAARRWARERTYTHLLVSASMMMPDAHEKLCTFCGKQDMTLFETTYIQEL